MIYIDGFDQNHYSRSEMERKIILEQLQLLEKIRKEHEWVVIEQKEAEEEEKAEAKLESEATELAADKSEEN